MTASDETEPGEHPDERSIADVAMDVLVYAPVGVVVTAASDMPAMAAKGRARLEQELRNAHLVGRLVVDAGVRQVRDQFAWLAGEPEATPAGTEPEAPATGPTTPPARPRPAPPRATGSGRAPAPSGTPSAPPRDPAVDRAIPDYDTLSASQVVRRLDGLKPRELRAVVRHELANRGRRTILHRAEQLLGETPPAAPPTTS